MLNYNSVKKIWLKGIGLILLLIAINGVSMTSEENEIVMGSEESQEGKSEELDFANQEMGWEKEEREEREYIEKIKAITKGKGIFSMVVTNAGSKAEDIEVSIYMTNPPVGCEYLGGGKLGFLYSNLVRIIPNETITLGLPAPFMSPQNDLEQYDNTDNLLPLPEGSKITIKITNTRNPGAIIRFPKCEKIFEAKYLSGTRLIELPAEIPITINYDYDHCEPAFEQIEFCDPLFQETTDFITNSLKEFGFY